MLAQVHMHFEALEERRRHLLTDLESMSAEELRFRPRPNAWNALQIARHLLLAEELGVVEPIRSGWTARVTTRRLSQRVGGVIVGVVMRFGIKVNVPRPHLAPAEPDPDLMETRERWDMARAFIRQQLESLTPEMLGRPLMRHPVSGPLAPVAGLSFLVQHMDRHMRQMRNTLALRDKG